MRNSAHREKNLSQTEGAKTVSSMAYITRASEQFVMVLANTLVTDRGGAHPLISRTTHTNTCSNALWNYNDQLFVSTVSEISNSVAGRTCFGVDRVYTSRRGKGVSPHSSGVPPSGPEPEAVEWGNWNVIMTEWGNGVCTPKLFSTCDC